LDAERGEPEVIFEPCNNAFHTPGYFRIVRFGVVAGIIQMYKLIIHLDKSGSTRSPEEL
jgi:hypothetical protein